MSSSTTKSVPPCAANPTLVSRFVPTLSTDSSSEDGENHLKLDHFAYKSKVRFAEPSHPRPFLNKTAVPVVETTKTSKSQKKSGSSPIPEFSDDNLAKLVKCVSCDTKWTTRKTAAQKMAHVKSCARKKSLSGETVRVLILHEIEKAVPVNIGGQWKGKGKASDPLPQGIEAPKTFMEDVLDDAAPRTKGKRPEVVKSVRNVAETRDIILDRARALLGTFASSDSEEVNLDCQTQIFGPSKLVGQLEIRNPPLTQPFGESAFRPKQTPSPSHSVATKNRMINHRSIDKSEHAVDFIPKSWSAPSPESSVLGRALRTKNDSTLEYFPPPITSLVDVPLLTRNQSCEPCGNKAFTKDPAFHDSRYSEELQPNSSPVGTRYGGSNEDWDWDTAHDVYNEWNNDEAFLHFDPEAEIQHLPEPRGSQEPSQQPDRQKNSMMTGQSQKFIPSESSQVPSKHLTKQVKKSKQRLRDGIECPQDKEFDDDLRKTTIDEILNDKTLHLRILRFEPIHFEVFCQLANKEQLERRGLRFKLRKVLDTLGVNFYGADPQGWNRR